MDDVKKDNAAQALIDAWVAVNGRAMPWAMAVNIIAIVCDISDENKQQLLSLDE